MPKFHLYPAEVMGILPQLTDESIRVTVTSPPYNIGKRYGDYKDKLPRDTYLKWSFAYLKELFRITRREDGHLFLNVGAIPVDPMIPYDVLQEAIKAGWKLQNRIVWVKSIAVSDTLSYGHFKPINSPRFLNDCQEDIWHLTPTGSSPLERKAEGVGVAYQDQSNAKRWANGADGRRCAGNAWYIPYKTVQSSEQKEHPCPFPYELPLRCMRLAGLQPEEWAFDPFMGRGTTGEAALDLGASFAGIDQEESYCVLAEANLNRRLEEKKLA